MLELAYRCNTGYISNMAGSKTTQITNSSVARYNSNNKYRTQ
jgi:hypothetical protein